MFLPNGQPNLLLDAYRILVAIELALKDVGFTGGHDIPSMLAQAAAQYPMLARDLNTHQGNLRRDLGKLTCNSIKGPPAPVSANNYPHARYTRFTGDWNGDEETPPQSIAELAQTCHNLLAHLKTHNVKATLGIQL